MNHTACSNEKWTIRVATKQDVPRILEIYSYYVEETNVSFEYVTPSIEEFLERYMTTIEKYPYLVLESNGIVEGYAYASAFKGRKAYSWGVESTIYFDKCCRGGGRGRALYTALESYLKQQNIVNVNACIVHPYSDSVKFHEKMGFEIVAHFHKCGYKFNKWHDMVWMEKIIGEHKEDMPEVISFQNIVRKKG